MHEEMGGGKEEKMSVLVKGVEMPKSCDVCDFVVELDEGALGSHNYCGFPGNGVYVDDCIAARHKNCPFELVPPHGRLIDADAVKAEWEHGFYKKIVDALMDDAPTIIEAEPCNDLAKPNNDPTVIEAEGRE